MVGGGCAWSRRLTARLRTLRALVRDTQKALHDVSDILQVDPEFLTSVQALGSLCSRVSALVILGCSAEARARLLHCLLGRRLLPERVPRATRWLRIQYGSSTAVHLTLGNSEFELVEDLECNKQPWDTLPIEDLIRNDQTDLATMLEIELNNQFLKDGFRIIVPPAINETNPDLDLESLKKIHSELIGKREAILGNYNPVYLYAIDRTGRNIFRESFCDDADKFQSEDDFTKIFNLYNMNGDNNGDDKGKGDGDKVVKSDSGGSDEPYVFTAENCLDFHQVKQLNSNSQIHFVLFNDSPDIAQNPSSMDTTSDHTESTELMLYRSAELPESDQGDRIKATESNKAKEIRLNEHNTAFMNELLDQWEIMTNPVQKHYVKSQWSIVNDQEIMDSCDQRTNADQKPRDRMSNGDRVVKTRTTLLNVVGKFASDCLQSYLLEYCTKLSEIHVRLVQQFLLASFDLARELQVVPKKIQFVATQEQFLYETITKKFTSRDKRHELLQIMQEVLDEVKTDINNMDWSVDDLPHHQDHRFQTSSSTFYTSTNHNAPPSKNEPFDASCQSNNPRRRKFDPGNSQFDPANSQFDPRSGQFDPNGSTFGSMTDELSDGEEAESYDSYNFDDYEVIESNDDSLNYSYYGGRCQHKQEMNSMSYNIDHNIHIENESELLSLSNVSRAEFSRALPKIPEEARTDASRSSSVCTNTVNISTKEATIDVQQTVLSKLSRKISLKLVKFVDCLRDSYFGTLQRCLGSLESSCGTSSVGNECNASLAARQLQWSTRRLQLAPASNNALHDLLDSLRSLAAKLRIVSGVSSGACCVLSPRWRRDLANKTIHSMNAHRLARIVSAQILERLRAAHERYQSALTSLESALANRLHHTEDVKLAIRKRYAPGFARLCLESTSMVDLLMYKTPELGREIGRGQYGVVYSIRGSWAGHRPVAAKSLLPADDRHYHELAMESFYNRSIPRHPRIVPLLGSVVSRTGGPSGPGGAGGGGHVLLVSPRLVRDLHQAVRQQISYYKRMRIANDIVCGIRYLHSLGLVHRDIKMKNVLLDADDRASLADLGFCAAESLMSGSVVGTPVHMAPELLAGDYCATVDVYAFGILFWYLCAGSVKLPAAFEAFQNKEQLWSKVKRGLRPERLPCFSDECWDIMQSCWATEPSQRALLGDIQLKLQTILAQCDNEPNTYRNNDDIDSEEERFGFEH